MYGFPISRNSLDVSLHTTLEFLLFLSGAWRCFSSKPLLQIPYRFITQYFSTFNSSSFLIITTRKKLLPKYQLFITLSKLQLNFSLQSVLQFAAIVTDTRIWRMVLGNVFPQKQLSAVWDTNCQMLLLYSPQQHIAHIEWEILSHNKTKSAFNYNISAINEIEDRRQKCQLIYGTWRIRAVRMTVGGWGFLIIAFSVSVRFLNQP